MKKALISFYLFVLCGTAFGIFILGVFVAPVIFGHEALLHIALYNRFEAGLLMTRIFQRFNIVLALCGIMILAVEGSSLRKAPKSVVSLGVLSIIEIAMFLFYFTPAILNSQAAGEGAVNTLEFINVHNFAELDFKAMLLTITALTFLKFSKVIKENPCDDDKEEPRK